MRRGYDGTAIVDRYDWCSTRATGSACSDPTAPANRPLIKLLAGTIPALRGERIEARHLAVGYFAQHQLEQLQAGELASSNTCKQLDPQASEQSLRDYLGGFGFIGDKALEAVAPFLRR